MGSAELAALRGSAQVVYVRPERLFAETSREHCLAGLSEAERVRMRGFASLQAADLFLAAHTLARCLIAQLLDCAPRALAFRVAQGGRPELTGPEAHSEIRFNLAHTRGLCVCGVAVGAAIGVDVEHLSRTIELSSLARRACSPRELSDLQALSGSAQRRRFVELWTLKEAYVKATGLGLARSLRSVSFAADKNDPVPVSFEAPSVDDPTQWCMRRFQLLPEHCVAVALRSHPAASVHFREWRGGSAS